MEHHNIHGCNNTDELPESLKIAAARESTNIFNNMPKEEMQKLMIELTTKMNRCGNLAPYNYTVNVVNFYDSGPLELVANEQTQQLENDGWYLFTLRKPVSPGCIRASRNAGGGKWEQNGATNPILGDGKQVIGYQRFFEYKRGGSDKTHWRLFEYEELISTHQKLPKDKLKYNYVLCKLYKISKVASSNNNPAYSHHFQSQPSDAVSEEEDYFNYDEFESRLLRTADDGTSFIGTTSYNQGQEFSPKDY